MSEFQLILVYLHLYCTHVCVFTPPIYYHNGCGLIFVSTDHSLEFALNFHIGHCIDQSFIKIHFGVVLTGSTCFCCENSMSQLFIIIYQQYPYAQL